MSTRTYVVGVGMTRLDEPGTKEGDHPDRAREAGEGALADAGAANDQVEIGLQHDIGLGGAAAVSVDRLAA